MKKLMIAAAIVCAAAVSQAAVANWNASASEIHNGTGVEESYYSGTAYFFDASKMDQATLFGILADGGAISTETTGYVAEGNVSSGNLSKTFAYGDQNDGKTYNYYFVLVEDDKAYFSNIVGKTSPEGSSAKAVGFSDQYQWDGGIDTPNSMSLPTDGYQEAGRWAAVPEPTSGLLLLLGVAGLALKRRRV